MPDAALVALISTGGLVLAALVNRPSRNRRQRAAYYRLQRLCPHVEARGTVVDNEIKTVVESRVYRPPGGPVGICGFCGGTFDPSAHIRMMANWRDLLKNDPHGTLSLLEKNNRAAARARRRCDRLGGPPE